MNGSRAQVQSNSLRHGPSIPKAGDWIPVLRNEFGTCRDANGNWCRSPASKDGVTYRTYILERIVMDRLRDGPPGQAEPVLLVVCLLFSPLFLVSRIVLQL